MCPTIEVILTILPYFVLSIFFIEFFDNKNVEVKLMSITFFHSLSFILSDKLSELMPALLIRISSPPNSKETFSINSSILACSAISNFLTFIFGKFFFNSSNLSVFVPVAKTFPSNEINFFTKAFPIPPVAPVTNIFLFLKLIIKTYSFQYHLLN